MSFPALVGVPSLRLVPSQEALGASRPFLSSPPSSSITAQDLALIVTEVSGKVLAGIAPMIQIALASTQHNSTLTMAVLPPDEEIEHVLSALLQ